MQNRLFLAGAVLICIFFAYLSLWADNGLLRMLELGRVKNKILTQNHDILEQNLSYVQEIKKLKELPYIEQKARNELGFVRPNEVVYIMNSTPRVEP